MPTQVGIFYWICGAAENFGNNRETVQRGKETSCTFIGYKQDNCMEQRSQDFQERARRRELTDRELYGIRLNLGEDDLTTAGDLLYLVLDNEGKNFESIALADQILKDRRYLIAKDYFSELADGTFQTWRDLLYTDEGIFSNVYERNQPTCQAGVELRLFQDKFCCWRLPSWHDLSPCIQWSTLSWLGYPVSYTHTGRWPGFCVAHQVHQ